MKKVIISKIGNVKLVLISGGVFQMGSSETEEGRWDDEGPVHEVRISPFYLGRYPVTNAEYGRYLSANPKAREPDYWGDRRFNQSRQPVVGVSWEEARQYANWAEGRLPSEAEWEYACRAGTTTRFYSGDTEKDLARVAWYGVNSGDNRDNLHPVGEKEPNAFGLYDMHGNVWEWVEDDFHDSYKGAPSDGRAWVNKPRSGRRVLRGGSWNFNEDNCRSAYRNRYYPDYRNYIIGFRVLLDIKE